MIEAIYHDSRFEEAHVISNAHFRLVCRYLTSSWIDHIHAFYSGKRPANHIALPRKYEVPKAFADVVSGIGTILYQGDALLVCPQPEAAPKDVALALHTQVTFVMINSFQRLVQAAKVRGFIRTVVITSACEGTGWWILTARQPTIKPAHVAVDDSVAVYGCFEEWIPVDGMTTSIV